MLKDGCAMFFCEIIQGVWQFWVPWCEFSKSKGWNQIPATKINGLFELDPLPTIIKHTSENSTCMHLLFPWIWEKMMSYCIIFWKRCEFTYGVYHLPQVPLHSRPRSGGQSSLRARLSRVWVERGWDGRPPSATVSRIHRGIPQLNGRKEPPPFETNPIEVQHRLLDRKGWCRWFRISVCRCLATYRCCLGLIRLGTVIGCFMLLQCFNLCAFLHVESWCNRMGISSLLQSMGCHSNPRHSTWDGRRHPLLSR